MKQILEQIDVAHRGNVLYMICWRGGSYAVERIIDNWASRGPWWGADELREYSVVVTCSGVMEIYHSSIQGWVLSRVYD
ncbi:MAG: hypothetical protein RLZZ273_804 [Bacteroidota bacterium]|jgi:hypothetical protein